MSGKCTIIGIGAEGRASLPERTLGIIASAGLLVGGERHLALFPELNMDKLPIGRGLAALAERIEQAFVEKQVVVLASGDPLFYGIGRKLLESLPADRVEIIPNVSAMQWAFAKLRLSWEDAAFASAHGRPLEDLLPLLEGKRRVGIFTDPRNTPSVIACFLMEWGCPNARAFVCENLGADDERLVETRLHELVEQEFGPLNVLVLLFEEPVRLSLHSLGIPDGAFAQRTPLAGLITKAEVRVLSIAKLNLHASSRVWDIGAGSGSVAIEAARIARNGQVFAVERDLESVGHIRTNRLRFRTPNVRVCHAEAPEGLEDLPDPDAAFVGGSGGHLEAILAVVCRRLRPGGRVALNFATLENLHVARGFLEHRGIEPELTLVNISRGEPIADLTRLTALNPVFILSGTKPSNSEEIP